MSVPRTSSTDRRDRRGAPAHGPGARAQAAAARTPRRRSSPAAATARPASPTSARRRAWPKASSTGTSRTRSRSSPSSCARSASNSGPGRAMDDDADPVTALAPGHRGLGALHGRARRFFALLEVERHDRASPPCCGRVATSTCRTRRAWCGSPSGRAGARRPRRRRCSPWASSEAVAQFSHYHRTGRLKLSIDELATFVGQWTIQAPAAVPSPTAR